TARLFRTATRRMGLSRPRPGGRPGAERPGHLRCETDAETARRLLLCHQRAQGGQSSGRHGADFEAVMKPVTIKPVVWGVLSTAKIGVNRVIPALLKSDMIRVKGIGSRSFAAAQDAVGKLGLEQAWGSYEDVINDPEVE